MFKVYPVLEETYLKCSVMAWLSPGTVHEERSLKWLGREKHIPKDLWRHCGSSGGGPMVLGLHTKTQMDESDIPDTMQA